ncbi:MAG: hypothetical protein ABSG71_13640 [Thermodesulfobacteriota bacterium]|jgi:hypothetical protein
MKFSDVIFGAMGFLSLIFTLFPGTLDEVRKMDSYRLIVFFILGICIIYWIYFALQHSNFIKGLINKDKRIRIIRDPRDPQGFTYLLEKDICCHIPDPETFNYLGNYFGFSWKDLEDINSDDFKRKFKIGRQLPSIRACCQKIELIEKK